jgi:isoleucyl-tRNA synthetase
MDNIEVAFLGNEKVEAVALRNAEEIKADTLALALHTGTKLDNAKEWNINGETVTISVKKL